MEAVAAAASIAGIITLAAQAIDGLQKLHAFLLDISSASKTVSRLLSDINSLVGVLHNIDNVLGQAETQRRNQNFAQLDIKLEDCTKDVRAWLEIAKSLRPGGESGGRSWVRRARLAGKGEVVSRIRDEIGRHRQALCLSLAVFGRLVMSLLLTSLDFPTGSYRFWGAVPIRLLSRQVSRQKINQDRRTIDLHTSEQIYQMRGRFDDALTMSLSNHGVHEQALRRIEHYSMTSMRSSVNSMQSMDSVRTELSRLEAMITGAHAASTTSIEQPEEDLPMSPSGRESRFMIPDSTGKEASPEAPARPTSGELPEPIAAQSPAGGSSSASHYSSKASSTRQTGQHRQTDVLTHPADFQLLVKEQEDISKRFSEISNGHESALLYAEFARSTSPIANAPEGEPAVTEVSDSNFDSLQSTHVIKPHGIDQEAVPEIRKGQLRAPKNDTRARSLDRLKTSVDVKSTTKDQPVHLGGHSVISRESLMVKTRQYSSARTSTSQRVDTAPAVDHHASSKMGRMPNNIDHSVTYDLLQQSLTAVYPPTIAEYIMLQNLVILYESHTLHLENRPSAPSPSEYQIGEQSNISVQPHLRKLRNQLEALQDAMGNAERACLDCGYSQSDLNNVCVSASSHKPVERGAHNPAGSTIKNSFGIPKVISKERADSLSEESDTYFSSEE